MRAASTLLLSLLLAGCGAAGETSDGWSGTPPADAIPIGEACEAPWFECSEASYCNTADVEALPTCEGIGVCEAIPEDCSADGKPVCGCDGQLYEHACAAAQAGVNTQAVAACPAPPGSFPCGPQFCEIDTQYCEYVWGHGGPASWSCGALDCEAGLTGCDCITSPTPCGDEELFPGQWCDDLEGGGTLLQCVPA